MNEALAAGIHAVVSDRTGVAAAVADMAGVYIASPAVTDLARAMSESRAGWRGPIEKPEILAYGPGELAEIVLNAAGGTAAHSIV